MQAHILCAAALCTAGAAAAAQDAQAAGRAFADHCFSPYLTAERAREAFAGTHARVEFYDLRPFSSAAPSPVTGRAATKGTDRRCEVAFDGAYPDAAAGWVTQGLTQEGLTDRAAEVPAGFPTQPGAALIAAAQLNPNRIAVVQAGVRPGPNGDETYLSVERLDPLDGSE